MASADPERPPRLQVYIGRLRRGQMTLRVWVALVLLWGAARLLGSDDIRVTTTYE